VIHIIQPKNKAMNGTDYDPLISVDNDDRNNKRNSDHSHDHHEKITIVTKKGTMIQCDYCVVTIPAGCLQRNQHTMFQPSLCPEKIKSIQHVRMGSYKKVFLTFSTIFWPIQPAFLGLVQQQPQKQQQEQQQQQQQEEPNNKVQITTEKKDSKQDPLHSDGCATTNHSDIQPDNDNDQNNKDRGNEDDMWNLLLCDNLWARDGIPSIEIILHGKLGEWANYKTDDVIRTNVLKHFYQGLGIENDDIDMIVSLSNSNFPKNHSSGPQPQPQHPYQCTKCHITRWEEDPYSYGAYSSTTLGCIPHDIDELNRPEWNHTLFFSGEATMIEYEGSVHAALISGTNTANKIIEQANKNKNSVSNMKTYPTNNNL
jgi:Flavin containing amine oxidoreductase